MKNHQKCLDFIKQIENTLNTKPGMLGSIADISAMFYVADNIHNILLYDEMLPHEFSWNEFLIEKKLFRDLKSIPIEENWNFDRFVELRCLYLKWLENHRNRLPVQRTGPTGE